MENATLPQDVEACGNSNTGARDNQDPGASKPAIAEDLSIGQLAKYQTQNIQRFQEILEKLLSDCEFAPDKEPGEPQHMIAKLKEIRLSIRLLESIKTGRQRAASRLPGLEIETEEVEETFAMCLGTFILALDGYFGKELFPDDPERSGEVSNRIAVEFDKAFRSFITTNMSIEEN